jgi:DNA damage-inducible protein 1
VLCEVNGFLVPAIIDTGAQITVMSASCAKRCRISNKIDARFSGRAVGVGSSDIIGRIGAVCYWHITCVQTAAISA